MAFGYDPTWSNPELVPWGEPAFEFSHAFIEAVGGSPPTAPAPSFMTSSKEALSLRVAGKVSRQFPPE